ncbi:LOW QUALITY PROTEIN: transcription elongation factor A protein-like 5 [Dipodomys merriami]|uniref:LOW QUALITY PROTEIN: transcription elongation factor A protein-like 5 n=1 Tax=Dipodomys merriami TaxID=94247 RepID=UPI003855B984
MLWKIADLRLTDRGATAGVQIGGCDHQPRQEKERPAVSVQVKKDNLNMEKFYKEKEGKPENEGTDEDEGSTEDEGNTDEEKSNAKGKAAREGQLEGEGGPEEEGHPRDEDKSGKQGKSSEDEGQPPGEGKAEPQAKAASESRAAAEKRPAEDYVPRKAKRKTDRGTTDDSPKNSREDLQDRHLSSEEMMRECADMSRAQEELRKKQKMGGCHWMQRDAQDAFAQGANGVSGE